MDQADGSTRWRQIVYREAFDSWTQNPRNFFLGVGMDSHKRFAREWRLFDNGRLAPRHSHSTPLQLLVERGLPALLIWLWILVSYLLTLQRSPRTGFFDHWLDRGIVLGAMGRTAGFLASGVVHQNLSDGEVATVFYLISALSVFYCRPLS